MVTNSNFKIEFNNNFLDKDTNYNVELYSIDNGSFSDDDDYVNKYQVAAPYLTFDITQADTIPFGNLNPDTVICYATGTIASVTTNSENGYTLGVHDSTATPNSSLLHTDTTTRIPKMTNGTVATPVVWGTNYGLGIGLYAADTTKEAKWGSGTTVCDANNKYAAIPETVTTAHTVTGHRTGADTSSWSFKIDVPNTQKTGSYSGIMTFTATGVLE